MAGFIKFATIDGESLDAQHVGWSDIIHLNSSVVQPMQGMLSTGRRSYDPVRVTKKVDAASVPIFRALVNHEVISEVKIDFTRSFTDAGRRTYLQYILRRVIVREFTLNGQSQSDDIPVEDIALAFAEIEVTYTVAATEGREESSIMHIDSLEAGR